MSRTVFRFPSKSKKKAAETFVFLDLASKRIIARAASDFRAEPGAPVWVNLDLRESHFFDRVTGNRV